VESKAKIMGHPILIQFPLGLLSTSVGFDVVHLLTGNGRWSEVLKSHPNLRDYER
jgi:uncharacterized membrane protein